MLKLKKKTMVYNEKDNIELITLYEELAAAKATYQNTVNKIFNQADELLKKYYIGKFFYRKDSDGRQTIYKVTEMEVNFPNGITFFGPTLSVWENGNVDYRINDVIDFYFNIDKVYDEKEISEQEYNDFLTKYGFIGVE